MVSKQINEKALFLTDERQPKLSSPNKRFERLYFQTGNLYLYMACTHQYDPLKT